MSWWRNWASIAPKLGIINILLCHKKFSFLFNVYSESFYGDKYLTTNIVNVYLCVCQRPFFLSLLISSEDLQMTWQLAKYWKGEEELSPPNVKKVHQFK